MTQELSDKLEKRFPKILKDVCFECGDGWSNIIYVLCFTIQNHIKNLNRNLQENETEYLCQATQVKEKFGTLSFYYDGGNDYIHGMVSMATQMSSKTCEVCGTMDNVGRTRTGWIKVLCQDCYNKSERFHDLEWKVNSTVRLLKLSRLLDARR